MKIFILPAAHLFFSTVVPNNNYIVTQVKAHVNDYIHPRFICWAKF